MNFLTPRDIANILHISYQNALIFIRCSGIPYLKIGNQYRVSIDGFNEFTKKTSSTKLEE